MMTSASGQGCSTPYLSKASTSSSLQTRLFNPILVKGPDIIIPADKVIRPHACRRPRHHPPAYKHRMRFLAFKRYACDTGSERFRPTYRSDTCREDGLLRSRSIVARMLSRLDADQAVFLCKRPLLPCRPITAVGMVAGCAMRPGSLSCDATRESGCVMQPDSRMMRPDNREMRLVRRRPRCDALHLGAMPV